MKTLFINAKLNNELIQVTIDSGANINCICPDLIDLNLISQTHKYQLSGPDSTPLKLLGTTTININIEDQNFNISVCVTEILSSNIILGNAFLESHNAKITTQTKQSH